MIGETISHYEILERLGEGGMGVVYKARDLNMDRSVAIKFLPGYLSVDEDAKKRFVQEAKAASSLDHPNIGVVYEIDETSGGRAFIVTAHYEGQSLRKTLDSKEVSIGETLDITMQIASGLAKAHENGIVHCDIKPSNIMITRDARVKIIDFGTAKLAGGAIGADVNSTIGSAAYMSPEQISGEKVDQRTDIWSLGVLLYEMLAGKLPFKGDYRQAIIYEIMNKYPDPLSSVRGGIPYCLERVISMALEKDQERRYRKVETLIYDIRTFSTTGIALPRYEKSIVVLPFKDISPDRDNEYFSDGLTEEIIADLSMVRSLRVISRTSSMRLKDTDKDAGTIGHDLNVHYLLEGSVRKSGDSLRITAQLIDVIEDSHLWAEKYSGTLEEVFDFQRQVALAIVDALKLKLSSDEERRMIERPIEDIDAYQHYLRARQDIMLFTEEGLNRALHHLRRAEEIVGENPLLLTGIGYVYWSLVNNGIKTPEEYLPKVAVYAGRAFELEPDSPQGHMLLGVVNFTKGNAELAIRHLRKALAIDPNDPDALFWLVIAYGHAGRTAIAMQFAERLVEVDPLTPINHATPGFALLCEGRFDLALEKERKWNEMEPNTAISKFWYAWVLAQNDRVDEAKSLLEEAADDTPKDLWARIGLCFVHAFNGASEELKSLIEDLSAITRWDSEYSLFMAECHALLDEKEKALGWLNNAVNRGFINYPFLAKYDDFLENLRGEEPFRKLLEKIIYEWEHFEA